MNVRVKELVLLTTVNGGIDFGSFGLLHRCAEGGQGGSPLWRSTFMTPYEKIFDPTLPHSSSTPQEIWALTLLKEYVRLSYCSHIDSLTHVGALTHELVSGFSLFLLKTRLKSDSSSYNFYILTSACKSVRNSNT